ncbi:MAG: CDP-diacylglycerol--glycerol-3-phosphate 3-phosphatidyltransferase [Gammaproteobacteria bacterium]|nr:CDP-diacylglycerol--glycerol-3-phosphate 3-phosphatidyltransferase [Gammaproteobacteria bacterium]
MNLNIPNTLTLIRIGFIPVIMVVFYLPYEWARPLTAWLYFIAGITDWFDGYLARKLKQQSALGAFLDPVADKLIVAVALIMLAAAYHDEYLIILGAIIIIGREITISALREWMAGLGKSAEVSVSMLGKVKTTVQMFAIGFLLHHYDFIGMPTHLIGVILLVIASVLTVLSMLNYLKAAWQVMRTSG